MTHLANVAANIDSAASNISDSVNNLMRDAKPIINQAAERTQQFAHESLKAASNLRGDIENSARDLTSHATHMIRHDPLKAILIAAATGAAVAALVGLFALPHSNHRSH